MAKTSAQRQKDYREQRPFAGQDGNGERRLNTWVSTGASIALGRLAKRYGVTKRELLERLIREADQVEQAKLEPGTEEWDAYFNP